MRCFSEILESWKGVGQTVQRVLQDILTDCSTEDKFEFSIVCEECGKIWKSKAIVFSKARVHPVTEGKKVVYAALYQREKKEAHLKALKAGENYSAGVRFVIDGSVTIALWSARIWICASSAQNG